jgi:hypothetical protein
VGDLRFALPQYPATNRTGVQTGGDFARTCPQAAPFWELTAIQFLPQYLEGVTNVKIANTSISLNASTSSAGASPQAQQDAAELEEDCLFLDVFVPQKVFDYEHGGNGAPVLGKSDIFILSTCCISNQISKGRIPLLCFKNKMILKSPTRS